MIFSHQSISIFLLGQTAGAMELSFKEVEDVNKKDLWNREDFHPFMLFYICLFLDKGKPMWSVPGNNERPICPTIWVEENSDFSTQSEWERAEMWTCASHGLREILTKGPVCFWEQNNNNKYREKHPGFQNLFWYKFQHSQHAPRKHLNFEKSASLTDC